MEKIHQYAELKTFGKKADISSSTESSVHPFHRYLSKDYYVPHKSPWARDTAVSQEEQISHREHLGEGDKWFKKKKVDPIMINSLEKTKSGEGDRKSQGRSWNGQESLCWEGGIQLRIWRKGRDFPENTWGDNLGRGSRKYKGPAARAWCGWKIVRRPVWLCCGEQGREYWGRGQRQQIPGCTGLMLPATVCFWVFLSAATLLLTYPRPYP